jgi:hypothetical protein
LRKKKDISMAESYYQEMELPVGQKKSLPIKIARKS